MQVGTKSSILTRLPDVVEQPLCGSPRDPELTRDRVDRGASPERIQCLAMQLCGETLPKVCDIPLKVVESLPGARGLGRRLVPIDDAAIGVEHGLIEAALLAPRVTLVGEAVSQVGDEPSLDNSIDKRGHLTARRVIACHPQLQVRPKVMLNDLLVALGESALAADPPDLELDQTQCVFVMLGIDRHGVSSVTARSDRAG